MRRYGMIIAIGLLVLVNAVVLAGVAYNRADEPAATITLTEREMPLTSYESYSDRENTGLSMRLDATMRDFVPIGFHTPADSLHLNEAGWFNQKKLESIGFDCSLPLNAADADLHYQRMLSRKTYAVLEYEGTAWDAWLRDARKDMANAEALVQEGKATQEQLEKARKEFYRQSHVRSRLFVIDAANDPDMLRRQYGEKQRYLILPAIVRLQYYHSYKSDDGKEMPPRLVGRIEDIPTDTIYVPKKHRSILEKLLNDSKKPLDMYEWHMNRKRSPAYAVTIHVGRRAEPWIASIQELKSESISRIHARATDLHGASRLIRRLWDAPEL